MPQHFTFYFQRKAWFAQLLPIRLTGLLPFFVFVIGLPMAFGRINGVSPVLPL